MRSTVGQGIIWLSVLGICLAPLQSLQAASAASSKAEAVATKAEPNAVKTEAKASVAPKAAEAGPAAKGDPKGADATGADSAAKPAGHKSPGIAGGLAFFPGVAIHGTGHMYAGSWMKGLGLLAIEGAALGIGIPTAINGADRIQKAFSGAGDGGGLTDAGDSFRDVGIVLVSATAFLWTWFDDMAGAPIAASEYNRLAEERSAQAALQISPKSDGVTVAWVQRF